MTPSVSETGVSTSRMFAPGASACAYSTSSVVSPAHEGSNLVILPTGAMTVKFGGAG